ncbi:MAG: beta-lactamase family protein [Alphaproteobacteria bacterium]|nr:beta-lactamase family protein [Alphaproteobacteria bacterium]MBV9370260.1 beta-lactamase family protein [Alphaproteobacteria bacterium]MBV9899745.1 beta-lactamase family protein [Alphaproteobacteria bacterium]
MHLHDPADLGFDPARLARLDRFLADTYLTPGLLPHAQLLVARDGKPVHFSTLGRARGDGAPLGEDAIFRIASMTKPIVSLAFMMLVEEGRVSLDQPVAGLVPELADVGVYEGGGGGTPFHTRAADRPMMMIDLLRHTSGLTYDFQHHSNVDAAYRERRLGVIRAELGLEEFVGRLGGLPLEFSPGDAWNYSVSTDVLGLAVQRAAGMPLERFLETRILLPLGMKDTGFQVPAGEAHRLPEAWWLNPEQGTVLFDPAGAQSSWAKPPVLVSGGGGLVSTTADYHRFVRMLLGGGALDGVRLVGRKTLELMTRNHLPGGGDLTELSRSMFSEAIYSGQGFGLGFGINLDPAKAMAPGTPGEFYWGGIFSTYFFVDPAERVSMIFMTQLMPSSAYPVRRQLKAMIYSALS